MRRFVSGTLAIACAASGFLAGSAPAEANPLTRFFNSFKHPRHHQVSHRQKRAAQPATNEATSDRQAHSLTTARSTASQAGASPAQQKKKRREKLLAGIAVPNKPGFLRSPYTDNQAVIDVRGFPSGTEVVDPATGKTFVTP